MARSSSAHPIRAALAICAVAAFPGLFLGAPAANANVLEQLTGSVEEVVSPVVGTTPTVQQVGETVTTTAHEATAKIVPSATKAAAAATSAPAGTAGASTGPADDLTDKATKLVGGHEAAAAVASAAGAASKTAEAAVPAATAGVEDATGVTLPRPSVPSTTTDPGDPAAGAGDVSAAADSSAAPPDLPPAAPRTTYVPPPGSDGSTGAPLPRYVAFVWPAVALAGPSLAHFGESWGQAIERLATGASTGTGGEGGVAGVHASGGHASDGGSSSLFTRIPSAGARAFSSVPTSAWVYLGLLVLAVIAVALGVRREIVAGRRPY